MERVLITGAAGKIGHMLRERLRGQYAILRLTDIAPLGEARSGEEVTYADLRDLDRVTEVMKNVNAVVHFGGISREEDWSEICAQNIDGTHNVFEAARRSGVSRVVYASSNHAIGYYRRTRKIDAEVPFRTDSLYGASKAFGEILGRQYADRFGLEVVCLRIGSSAPRPSNIRMLSIWISHRDLTALVRASLTAPNIHFEVVYGVSANKRSWWINSSAAKIGYHPQDDSEDYVDEILADGSDDANSTGKLFQGGYMCDGAIQGNIELID